MYYQSSAKTFTDLAKDLRIYKRVKVKIASTSNDWGKQVSFRVQDLFLQEHEKQGSPLLYVLFDDCKRIEDETAHSWYYYTITDVCNHSVLQHAKLTCFKKEDTKWLLL